MSVPLSHDEFLRWVRTFRRSAFRLETRSGYAFAYERAEFDRFRAGNPTPPSDVEWWRAWLDRVAGCVADGKSIGRVRLVDTPLTDYQRWLVWSTPWHETAGENIRYMPRQMADSLGLVMRDWWLLDDACVIQLTFADDGSLAERALTIEPAVVAGYMSWRDVLMRHAIPAHQIDVAA